MKTVGAVNAVLVGSGASAPHPSWRGRAARGVALLLVPAMVAAALPSDGHAQPAPPPAYGGTVSVTTQPATYPGGGYAPAPYAAPTYAMPMPRREVPYDDGMAVPPGAVVIERTRRAMWITGLTLFFSFYGISILVAASASDSDLAPLWIPILGPWLQWAQIDDSDEAAGARFLLALDGLGQAAGALLFVLGVTMTRRYVVYGAENEGDGRRFAVLPFIRHDGGGLSLTVF